MIETSEMSQQNNWYTHITTSRLTEKQDRKRLVSAVGDELAYFATSAYTPMETSHNSPWLRTKCSVTRQKRSVTRKKYSVT